MATFVNPRTQETWFTVEYAAAQTATEIVAAPAAKKAILIHRWKWSSDSAIEFKLHDEDDNLVDGQYAAANGGQVVGFTSPFPTDRGGIMLAAAKALEITTVGAGNVHIGILYSVVDV